MPGPEADCGPAPSCAVLAFHKIGRPPAGGWGTWNYIPEEIFVAQLEQLAAQGFEVLDLAGFAAGLEEPARLPPRSALLTFDDGYRSMLTVAQPILERFALPAVCFVPTAYIGSANSWDAGNEPDESICTWAELAELNHRGTRIQSHSVSHRSFSDLEETDLRAELTDSKAQLEAALDGPVESLAFPYGDGGDPQLVGSLLQETGYRVAFNYKGGVCAPASLQPLQVPRVPMGPDTNLGAWLRGERR